MAWEMLPTNYKDAVWNGLKRYTEVRNEDGTVSFQDVTQYTNWENSFFGAKDANQMNEAMNVIMSMVENGTDLYTAFQEYFKQQKTLFESEGDAIIDTLETDYRNEITTFENQQEQLFNAWFAMIKSQLSGDVAGNLQTQIGELDERVDKIEANNLYFYNTTVPASAFVANATYEAQGYGVRAEVPLASVTSAMVPEVNFGMADAISGVFSPVAETYNGGVYLYAASAPDADTVIPTIVCRKGVV